LSRARKKYQGWKLNCASRLEGARAGGRIRWGRGEVPAAYEVAFVECREEATLDETQERLDAAHLLLVTGYKVPQQRVK
jgi:hypothetical protein